MKRTVILAAVTALLLSGCGSSDSSSSDSPKDSYVGKFANDISSSVATDDSGLSQLLHQRQLQNRLRSQHRKRKQMKLLKSQRYTTFPQPILPCRLFLFISN